MPEVYGCRVVRRRRTCLADTNRAVSSLPTLLIKTDAGQHMWRPLVDFVVDTRPFNNSPETGLYSFASVNNRPFGLAGHSHPDAAAT